MRRHIANTGTKEHGGEVKVGSDGIRCTAPGSLPVVQLPFSDWKSKRSINQVSKQNKRKKKNLKVFLKRPYPGGERCHRKQHPVRA